MFESNVRLWKYGDPKHYSRHIVKGNQFLRYDREHYPCILVYPILEWTDEDVKQFLKNNNFKLHEGYKEFGISGCKWCPVHPVDVYRKIMAKYPDLYDDFIELENAINKHSIRGGILVEGSEKRNCRGNRVLQGVRRLREGYGIITPFLRPLAPSIKKWSVIVLTPST